MTAGVSTRLPPMRLLAAVLLVAAGCGGARASEPKKLTPASRPSQASERPRPPVRDLPPLTDAEMAYRAELRRHVVTLADEIGERHTGEKWNLATAADYVARELEKSGFVVGRQGYAVAETMSQNLDVDVVGGLRGDEIIIVGAHYDSAVGTAGADDNASGVAALLALAKRYRQKRPARTVRFVAFANEEAPHFQTPAMGSLVYAKRTAERGERVILMLSLETIGYYSTSPGSQRYPDGLADRFPSTGHFVAIVGSTEMKPHVDRALAAFRSSASIPVEGAALPADLPGVGWSDHWSFWQLGFPAVMITDTAPFRYPHYHAKEDTPDKLDFDRMARAVVGIEAIIDALAGSVPGAKSAE